MPGGSQLVGTAVWRDGKIGNPYPRDKKKQHVFQELIDDDVYLKSIVDELVTIGAYGIRGVEDNYDALPDPTTLEERTIYVVHNNVGAPNGNGLYWVESGAWAYLSALTIDDAGEIVFDNAVSGLAATNVKAAIDEVEARVDANDTHAAGNGLDHSEVSVNSSARHAESHTAASHSDQSSNGTQVDSAVAHAGITTGNPHSLDAADVGAEAAGDIAVHAAIATAHQDAPGLIATHTSDPVAHQNAPGLIATHTGDAVAHQDAPALIATHTAIATAHQDAPALISTHAGNADAHHTASHNAASHSDIVSTGAQIDGAVSHAGGAGADHADVAANTIHSGVVVGNPHSLDAADVGAEASGTVATHAGNATAHQDAPALISTHAGNAIAHQDAPALISTHAGIPTAHQDAPALISTHAGDADAHHTQSHDAASHSDISSTGAQLDGAVTHATVVTGNPHVVTNKEVVASDDWTTPPVGTVVGEMQYDTTLSLPYWWDGAAWNDAVGAAHA